MVVSDAIKTKQVSKGQSLTHIPSLLQYDSRQNTDVVGSGVGTDGNVPAAAKASVTRTGHESSESPDEE